MSMSQPPHIAAIDFTTDDQIRLYCATCHTIVDRWLVPAPLSALEAAWWRHAGGGL